MGSSPGPWTVGVAENGVYIDAAGYTIAQVFGLQGNENAKLIARAPEMASMLKELEWAAVDHRDMEPRCPECDARAKDGHAPDCRLAALIKELP